MMTHWKRWPSYKVYRNMYMHISTLTNCFKVKYLFLHFSGGHSTWSCAHHANRFHLICTVKRSLCSVLMLWVVVEQSRGLPRSQCCFRGQLQAGPAALSSAACGQLSNSFCVSSHISPLVLTWCLHSSLNRYFTHCVLFKTQKCCNCVSVHSYPYIRELSHWWRS